jgi:hypothetical protein
MNVTRSIAIPVEAEACQRSHPEESQGVAEPRLVQVLRCQELFVMTNVEPRPPP